jgi:hypothetical protein
MALREIMRVPTDKLSMMAASEVGQSGPSVKTEQEGDQPEAAAGDQPEADDTMDNDGGGQDVKLEDLEAIDGGRVATKLPFTIVQNSNLHEIDL